MDHVLKSMEAHSKNLETQVNDRTKMLADEMRKSEDLLYRMLPKYILCFTIVYTYKSSDP